MPCKAEKEFLSHHNIPFREINVRENKEEFLKIARMGVRSLPATLIDGELVLGFDHARFTEILLKPKAE